MRYRNYGKRNNSFGHYFANELYKGLKQNQKNIVSTNNLKPTSEDIQTNNDIKVSKVKIPNLKRNILIFSFVVILFIVIAVVLSSHFEKQNIIKQVENLSVQCGLKNVEIVYFEKDPEYDWYDISIKCSNFGDFSFEEMKDIEATISYDYIIYIESFVSKGKKYEILDDVIYIDGERFTIEKEAEEDKTEKTFRYWQGMNGSWTYRCEKKCDETCKNCRSCIKGRENFGAECTFQYGASYAIGWIGCPKCGDVDNEYWHNWYEEKL